MCGADLILIVFVVAILIEETAEFFYRRSDKYLRSLGGTGAFHRIPDGLTICNIGSGPGMYAISYDNYKGKGFNFSTSPQSFKYGFRILEQFKEKISDHAIIIIIIMCPLSFGKNASYRKKDYSDKFYGILPKDKIDGYSKWRAFLLYHPLALRIVKKVRALFKNLRKRKQAYLLDEPAVISSWKKEFDLYDLQDANQAQAHIAVFQEKVQILLDGISFCQSQKWHPVFVIPPVPEKIRRYISNEFIQKFVYDNLNIIRKTCPEIILLDYYSDVRFKDNLFGNGVFVNEAGRELFSNILFNDINQRQGT